MTNSRKVLTFCAGALAAWTFGGPPALAASAWTSGPGEAGLAAKGGGETIGFRCAGAGAGALQVILSGFDAGLLQEGLDYTVVVTVDGTAYRRPFRATPAAQGRRALLATAPAADLAGLLDALSAGAKAEIASPAGREPLSLKGSGKALKALRAACR